MTVLQQTPDLSIELSYGKNAIVCGIDEVGRGPLAGTVITAAVYIPDIKLLPKGIHDSKKLTAKKREDLFKPLCDNVVWAIGESSIEEIDQINILQATLLAMSRAAKELGDKLIKLNYSGLDAALIDGIHAPKDLPCHYQCITKGDSKSLSIATASIIAKVYRDNMMAKIGLEYPEYGFENHAGYGTKQHLEALEKYGITKYHRRSFAPIARLLKGEVA